MQSIKSSRCLAGSGIGFLLGFLVLHPFSMVLQDLVHPVYKPEFVRMLDAFKSTHLFMAFFFGVLGFLVGCCVLFLFESLSREKDRVKILEGLLSICSYCRKIKDSDNGGTGHANWIKIEEYISKNTDADFSHGICPKCYDKLMKDFEEGKTGRWEGGVLYRPDPE